MATTPSVLSSGSVAPEATTINGAEDGSDTSVEEEAQGSLHIILTSASQSADLCWSKRWVRVTDGYFLVYKDRGMDKNLLFAAVWLRGCVIETNKLLEGPRLVSTGDDPAVSPGGGSSSEVGEGAGRELRFDLHTPVDGTIMVQVNLAESRPAWIKFIQSNIERASSSLSGGAVVAAASGQTGGSVTTKYRVIPLSDRISDPSLLSSLIKSFRKGVSIGTNYEGFLTSHQRSFSGTAVVDFLVSSVPHIHTRAAAVAFGQELLESRILHHVSYSSPFVDGPLLFRLQEDETPNILNTGRVWSEPPRAASVVAQDVRKRLLRLYAEFMSEDGLKLDIKGLARSDAFLDFVHQVAELQRVDLLELDTPNRLAFFINMYNVLVVHGQISGGAPANAWERSAFFNNTKYNIGGHVYSLNDIEHGVLRGNAYAPGARSRPFAASDPRLVHVIHPVDPRLHFALNCGAKSCPPIKVYSPENLEHALQMAAKNFLEQEVEVWDGGEVHLSKLLYWYKADFGATDALVLLQLAEYVGGPKGELLANMAVQGGFTLVYKAYDWSAMTI